MTNTWVHITRMIRMLIRKHDIAPVLAQLKLYILISSFLYIHYTFLYHHFCIFLEYHLHIDYQ